MLTVEALDIRFGGLAAVVGFDFALREGEICALMGPNGAGKSTVLNAVTGFVVPAAGRIVFGGKVITGLPPHRIAALGLRRTFQNNGIMREMSVLENVLTGLERDTPSTLPGLLFGMAASERAEREAVRRARATLAALGIDGLAERPAGALSFGQQRLVEIGRAVVAQARLLLLDEPAVGLSPAERLHLADVLRGLAGRGIGIVLVEHVQDLVMAVSDRVVVLHHGRRIADGTPQEVRRNRLVLEAYLGTG